MKNELSVFVEKALPAIPSFGGRTLIENIKKADLALVEMEPLAKIWNHSHSQWAWRHLNLSSFSPIKNLRQISAEIEKKKAALNETKYKYYKKQIALEKIKKLIEESPIDDLDRIQLQVRQGEIEHHLTESQRMIDGALKDVMTLYDLYNQIKKKTGDITEADAEEVESISHLQRSIQQCIRDIRYCGAITKGEQEYLEQIGVNPSKMQGILRAYVEKEEQDDWTTNNLADFVVGLSHDLINECKVDLARMKIQGFDSDVKHEYLTNGA
jgi:hypothetical protein